MNEIVEFCAKNSQRLAKADRQLLIRIANEIEALGKMKDGTNKRAARQIITEELNSLRNICAVSHYYPSIYADLYNKVKLEEAIAIAFRLLNNVFLV